jgi:Fe-S-cluster-containing hydrogenase component 2
VKETMGKKLLIDLMSLRELDTLPADAVLKRDKYSSSFKTIRELATFQYTCRHCENAPCIRVCPTGALDKDENGIIQRALNLCVRCKSCIVACPFGTLMDDLFSAKTSGQRFVSLADENDLAEFARLFPEQTVSLVDRDENPEENIFRLGDMILIREKIWQ